MPTPVVRCLAAAAALALGLSTWAQSPPPDPADPGARVPPVRLAQPLAHYPRWVEAPQASWRERNQRAAQAGGWRAYAREAARPEPTAPPAPPPASPPASGAMPQHRHGPGAHR